MLSEAWLRYDFFSMPQVELGSPCPELLAACCLLFAACCVLPNVCCLRMYAYEDILFLGMGSVTQCSKHSKEAPRRSMS